MKTPLTKLIKIDVNLTTPVYKQIVQSIYRNIENGVLNKDDMLPSVNSISEEFSLARGSVFTAYNDLRSAGIIDSIPGKGYFVLSTATKQSKNIFLLFSTFDPYKETLFNALRNSLPASCTFDIYFHQHSFKVFESLIKEQAGYYNTFIIMPEVHKDTAAVLSRLDPKHTFLLDTGYREYRKLYPGVYQNFEKDIYQFLKKSASLVSKYKRLFLVFPEAAKAKDMVSGFNKFASTTKTETKVISAVLPQDIVKYDAFIVMDDNDLVELINIVRQNKWQPGKDIGIISYNETILKSVVADGITTITTDFSAMGKTMADMVVGGNREIIENPFVFIDRHSF